eukprot:gene11017-biopygen10876
MAKAGALGETALPASGLRPCRARFFGNPIVRPAPGPRPPPFLPLLWRSSRSGAAVRERLRAAFALQLDRVCQPSCPHAPWALKPRGGGGGGAGPPTHRVTGTLEPGRRRRTPEDPRDPWGTPPFSAKPPPRSKN